MVRAILEGRKTVTRRPVKNIPWLPDRNPNFSAAVAFHNAGEFRIAGSEEMTKGFRCPFGQPGERLWVRESLGYDAEWGHYFKAPGRHGQVTYLCELFDDPEAETGPSYDESLPDRGVPSIHLPRRYSRITLEVTGVRVERLKDISEDQALAEGIDNDMCRASIGKAPLKNGYLPTCAFSYLWEQINGAGSWDANPWVWVVEFKRIELERKVA